MVGKPTVISTFAGCGGSSKLNFPKVPIYHGDIAKLTGKECMKLAGIKKGELDVLDGSPPCQGFSTAGKRKWNDPRNSLFKEYARLLNELQPKVFVMENVTGMVKGCMKQAYLTIIKTLRECGYKAKGEVLNAMYFNVPQLRQRVIIVGVRKDLGIEPSHPKPQEKLITVRQALKGVTSNTFCEDTKNSLEILNKKRHGIKLKSYFNYVIAWPDKVAPTLLKSVKYCGAGYYHPFENRSISIEEAKRIASYPDGFKFIGLFADQWARIGNSVLPNLMRAIAEHIKKNILRAK